MGWIRTVQCVRPQAEQVIVRSLQPERRESVRRPGGYIAPEPWGVPARYRPVRRHALPCVAVAPSSVAVRPVSAR